MRLFPSCLFFLPVMALISCASPTSELSGVVVYGHEARTIRLCGEKKLFWLHMTPELHRLLDAEFQRLTQSPYQELYLDFAGSMTNGSPGEFAREYDGTITLEEIRNLSSEIPDNCKPVRATP